VRSLLIGIVFILVPFLCCAEDSFKQTRELAEKGDMDSQFSAGQAYFEGSGVPRNYSESLLWFMRASKQGHGKASYQVATIYSNGYGVPQDQKLSHHYYKLSAEQGFAAGQYALAVMCRDGVVADKDPAEAFNWFKKAAEQNHLESQYQLALAYGEGLGTAQDRQSAFKWFEKAARKGHSEARVKLGYLYASGVWGKEDLETALSWYLIAATENDHPYAQAMLAYYYLEMGADTDAIPWLEKAADSGDGYAQRELGNLYLLGRGVTQNNRKAALLFCRAAAQGDIYSLHMCANETSQKSGFAAAEPYYLAAAEKGYSESQYSLCVAYTDVSKKLRDVSEKGFYWCRQAAYQGHIEAQIKLGTLYADGHGVGANFPYAYAWWAIAASKQNPLAVSYLNRAAGTFSTAHIQQGQEVAKEIWSYLVPAKGD